MINIRQFITEKLKVSSANVSKIDFNTFAEALYEYSKDRNRKFDLEYLDYYKDLPIEEFPYFEHPENPYSALRTTGYITELSGGIYKGEYRIRIFYVDASDKTVRSVTIITKDQFDVLTKAIEPEILQEIYDYLVEYIIDHA